MRLMLSATQHGWHPAAWRTSEAPLFRPRSLIDLAIRADESNFDAIAFGMPNPSFGKPGDGMECSMRFDALPLMGAAIGATKRIGICGYWPLDVAEPFHVARVMASLDHLSGGRACWIAGLAGRERLLPDFGYMPLLADAEAASRAGEFMSVVCGLCDSWEDQAYVADQKSGLFVEPDRVKPINHSGSYFTVRGPLNVPRPIQGHPVVMLQADGSDALLKSTLPFVDILLCDSQGSDELLRLRGRLRSSGLDASPPPLIIKSAMAVLARTEREAEQRVRDLNSLESTAWPFFVGTPVGFADELNKWVDRGACDGFDIRPAVNSIDLDLIFEAVDSLTGRSPINAMAERATLRDRLHLVRPD